LAVRKRRRGWVREEMILREKIPMRKRTHFILDQRNNRGNTDKLLERIRSREGTFAGHHTRTGSKIRVVEENVRVPLCNGKGNCDNGYFSNPEGGNHFL